METIVEKRGVSIALSAIVSAGGQRPTFPASAGLHESVERARSHADGRLGRALRCGRSALRIVHDGGKLTSVRSPRTTLDLAISRRNKGTWPPRRASTRTRAAAPRSACRRPLSGAPPVMSQCDRLTTRAHAGTSRESRVEDRSERATGTRDRLACWTIEGPRFWRIVSTTGTYGSSDIRLKKNVAPIAGGLDELLKLRGVTYEWTNPEEHANQTGIQRGFIAQEVEKVFPGWVGQDPKGFKTLSVQQIEALEVESIRTLKLQNDLLAERIKELESGRRPLVSGIDLNGVGFGIGGLAIAGAIVFVARRKREEQPRMIASS